MCRGRDLVGLLLAAVPAEGYDFKINICQTGFGHRQFLRGSERKVDDSTFFHKVAAIGNLYDDGMLVTEIDDSNH